MKTFRLPLLPLLHCIAALSWAAPAPAATVNVCDEAGLRAALAGGGTVNFACDGTITLSNPIPVYTNAILDATGHHVILSGNDAVRVFAVEPGADLKLINLTISTGLSTQGGGLYNAGGRVTLDGVHFVENTADGTGLPPTTARGGALFNDQGLVVATNCVFLANTARNSTNQPTPGAPAFGGAIYNGPTGTVRLVACRFEGNRAAGGWGGVNGVVTGPAGFDAAGGAIFNEGMLLMEQIQVTGNSAGGGPGGYVGGFLGGDSGGAGGKGFGGGVCNFGQAAIISCTIQSNTALGGRGVAGTAGHAVLSGSPAGRGGDGGAGGAAEGSGFYNSGDASLTASTLSNNRAQGGDGAPGGTGGAGGIPGAGGKGGNGGSGKGTAIFDFSGNTQVTNCTLALNQAAGGKGGRGGNAGPSSMLSGSLGADGGAGGHGGASLGAGLHSQNGTNTHVSWSTIASNAVAGGPGEAGGAGTCGRFPNPCGASGANGTNGTASGGAISARESGAEMFLRDSIIAHSQGGPNSFGPVTDGGHNLCSDGSVNLLTLSSRNTIDPRLGALADNGGPTLTMALLPGGPAVDAGDDATAPSVDQRGVIRPQLSHPDIGAYELVPDFYFIRSMQASGASALDVRGIGVPLQAFRLLASENLLDWVDVAAGTVSPVGRFQLQTTNGVLKRFYRIEAP
jgi:hypothetical protein